mmetsp:Transcript_10233/g.23178  ORF Transcript_10233/g.23178 Transcript_10233/m.23178 type:complete len:218 (+) Transcript_10233:791-1444(+)
MASENLLVLVCLIPLGNQAWRVHLLNEKMLTIAPVNVDAMGATLALVQCNCELAFANPPVSQWSPWAAARARCATRRAGAATTRARWVKDRLAPSSVFFICPSWSLSFLTQLLERSDLNINLVRVHCICRRCLHAAWWARCRSLPSPLVLHVLLNLQEGVLCVDNQLQSLDGVEAHGVDVCLRVGSGSSGMITVFDGKSVTEGFCAAEEVFCCAHAR